ncbi:MAG: hypothetical protein QM831_04460 [Kofleriaceae bacterium]
MAALAACGSKKDPAPDKTAGNAAAKSAEAPSESADSDDPPPLDCATIDTAAVKTLFADGVTFTTGKINNSGCELLHDTVGVRFLLIRNDPTGAMTGAKPLDGFGDHAIFVINPEPQVAVMKKHLTCIGDLTGTRSVVTAKQLSTLDDDMRIKTMASVCAKVLDKF